MTTILAVDPGPEKSGWVLLEDGRLLDFAKQSNDQVRLLIANLLPDLFAIERIASYGMPVGAETFETCEWVGRLVEVWSNWKSPTTLRRVYRREVKQHLCHASAAGDKNVRQALIDRFGPGKDVAIGRKATPGPLYGVTHDCWQALGLAVTVYDREQDEAVAA